MIVTILLSVIILFLLNKYIKSDLKLRGYILPPGPKGWPLIGSLPSLIGKVGLEQFQNWANIYGGIYFCKLGLHRVVVVTDTKIAQNMCVAQADRFSIRPKELLLGRLLGGKGIPFNDGESWKEHRTFVVQEFRKFGLSKSSVESRIQHEIQVLVGKLESKCGAPTKIHSEIALITYNVLWSVVSGQRFDWDDEQLSTLVKNLEANLQAVEILGAHNYLLPLMIIQLARNNPPKLLKILLARLGYFNRLIDWSEQGQRVSDVNEISESMIGDYLEEMRQRKKSDSGTTFSRTQLLFMVSDLFVAGGETTITTILWTILFLAREQEWQQKIREEIEGSFGREQLPSYTERQSCPSLEAFLNESIRYRTATAAMWHSTTEDSHVQGYDIPAGTWILMHFQGMHHNKEHWKEWDKFNPERFLKDGAFSKRDDFLPFSSGRRQCPGETLAKTELFIVIGSLVQHFRISLPHGKPPPSLRGIFGVTLAPEPFEVILEKCE